MTGIDYERSVVALACWQHQRQEMHRGMLAYGMLLRNRARAGWFDRSLYRNACAVLAENPPVDFPDAREPQFQALLQSVGKLFLEETSLPDRTGGALYCTSVSNTETIAGTVTAQIGQTLFFR